MSYTKNIYICLQLLSSPNLCGGPVYSFCRRVRSDMLRCFPFVSLWTLAGAKPHIVMHVIDDFGWNDPGFRNENEISTPTLILGFRTFFVCWCA